MNFNTAAIGETLRTRLNLAIPGGLLGNVVRSPAASLLFRPWFDRAALPALVRWILPASRLWAAAEACDYDSARFLEALPDLTRSGFAPRHVEAALREAQAARASRWRARRCGRSCSLPRAAPRSTIWRWRISRGGARARRSR